MDSSVKKAIVCGSLSLVASISACFVGDGTLLQLGMIVSGAGTLFLGGLRYMLTVA